MPDDAPGHGAGPDGAFPRAAGPDDAFPRGAGPDDAFPGGAGPDDARGPGAAEPEHEGALRSVRAWLTRLPRPVRVPLVVVTGTVLLLAGAAMLVLPGPGLLVMFAGVAVLAAEFPWAGRLVVRIRLLATRVWVPVRRWLHRRER
ncbi:PGPGW domain-containing protein [Cellulomonas sp. NS3]|uniref:PGPGW domain-containing protein n=1 Tax=Cellulomonas sp. NS3 TaxID=2973977 RepID=UPI002161E887|nr:PGPGW domain-containing protein [Cellulomonas sp. NS3]